MPPRQISPHSFDQILSDLGDDPAIPDPHGIRKSPAPQQAIFSAQGSEKSQSDRKVLVSFDGLLQSKKMGALLVLGGALISLILAGFWYFNLIKSQADNQLEEVQKLLLPLEKSIAQLHRNLDEEIDDLYEEIDILEVSIHSLKEMKASKQTFAKPQAHPHEQEIRRWRYLGNTQMGDLQQAFFMRGTTPLMLVKGDLAVGEWRLTHIEKQQVILSHPQGKSLTIKAVKSE